ncbi:conserved hypothetical protein, partial [Ixodes scapularis]
GFLDRENTPFYSLVIEAYDGGRPPFKGSMTVNITIQDVNDNQPIFNQSRYFATVAENATVGASVLRVFATDADSAENGRVSYSINRRQSDRENMFAIDPDTGVISVNKPLDFEAKDVHELVVVARDGGDQPLETTAFLAVTDANDNAPQFDRDVYYANVLEVADPGTSVLQLSATDRDEGNNSLVRYSIRDTPDTYSQWFRVDARTGLVTTRTHIDCETSPVPRVTVVATDSGSPPLSASATVLVTISDVNDNEPIFDQSFYNITVAEDERVGKCILK